MQTCFSHHTTAWASTHVVWTIGPIYYVYMATFPICNARQSRISDMIHCLSIRMVNCKKRTGVCWPEKWRENLLKMCNHWTCNEPAIRLPIVHVCAMSQVGRKIYIQRIAKCAHSYYTQVCFALACTSLNLFRADSYAKTLWYTSSLVGSVVAASLSYGNHWNFTKCYRFRHAPSTNTMTNAQAM